LWEFVDSTSGIPQHSLLMRGRELAGLTFLVFLLLAGLAQVAEWGHPSAPVTIPETWKVVDYLTAMLVIVTGGLVYMAVRQETHLRRIERPYVFIAVKMPATGQLSHSEMNPVRNDFRVKYRNQGKTPAILKHLRAYATVVPVSEGYPDALAVDAGARDIPPGMSIGAGYAWFWDAWGFLSEHEVKNIKALNSRLLCMGEIVYTDIFKRTHKTGFCWEYIPYRNGFIIAPTDDLNYYT